MGDKDSTVRARELGLALRRAVHAAGMNNAELAHRLGWSQPKVTHLFKGHRGPAETDVAQIVALCGITGAERDRLLRLARHTREPGWWQEYDDRLPTELRTLIDHENAAVAITNFQDTVIPGLLQTPDYMRALLRASVTIPDDEVEKRVTARLGRQQIFDQWERPDHFTFFIDEYALRRTGPGRDIMSGQVHHLLRMSVRQSIEVRVVRDMAGFHAGQSAFHLMEFAELHPVVHIEDQTSVLFLEREKTVAVYQRIVDQLARTALTEGQSRNWITHLATKLGEPREDRREPPRLAHQQLQQRERVRRGSVAG
jgi:predicted XRE-type DNA-binding protein